MSKGVMSETMNKRLTIIVVGFLFIFTPTFSTAGEGSWVDLVYDQEVPSKTKENFQKAIDAVNALLTKYKIVCNYSGTF
jgi:hypothetical protein